MKSSRLYEIYEDHRGIYTKAIVPGHVYDERQYKEKGTIYRDWNPYKSKLSAYIKKGAKNIYITKSSVILYLGASTGTTISHLSDMLTEGLIFGVDLAPRVTRELVFLAEKRPNICPILESASNIKSLSKRICTPDIIYQDLAQKNQVEIFLKNIKAFLPKGNFAFLAVKARSIDVTASPKKIFNRVQAELEKHVTIVDKKDLEPFQKDHMMFVGKY